MNFRHFLRPFAIVTVLTGIAVFGLAQILALPADAAWLAYGSWLGIAILTAWVAWSSLRAMDRGDFSQFQLAFMGGIIAKFLLAAAAYGLYAYTSPDKTMAVAWPFLASYVPFLVLETLYLSRASANKPPKSKS
jgi:hypothetical protein